MLTGTTDSEPIGLLAAWGRLPILVAETLRRRGRRVCCLGIKHHADPLLAELCDEFRWVGGVRIGHWSRWFRQHGVTHATMAGKVQKVLLYRPWTIVRLMPDWTTIKAFYPHFASRRKDRKDDTLLCALTDAFRLGGITFQPATDFAPELLVKPGHLAGPPATAREQSDIDFGWQIAKELGRLDIGQSVCVKGQAVLALEAIEGTDACIHRAGQLCASGGFTVVKVAKPQQDMRFDVPTVGVGTLETMAAAGARVLAIEAQRTILLDEDDFRRVAQERNISVVALSDRPAVAAA